MRIPLLPALLLVSSVLAHRSSSTNSHARRSLDPTRRQNPVLDARDSILGDLGLPSLPDALGLGDNTPVPGSTDTGTATATNTDSSAASSASDTSSPTSPPASSATDSSSTDSASGSTDSGSSAATTTTSAAAAATTTATASSSGNGGLLGGLGGIVSTLTSDLNSIATGLSGGLTSILDPSSTDPPSSSPTSGSSASSDSASGVSSTDSASASVTAPPSTITSAPASTDSGTASSSSSSSGDGGILSGILNPITSAVSSILDPITSAASSILDPITSAASSILDPITSAATSILDPATSIILPTSTPTDSSTPSSTITDTPTSSTTPDDPLSTIISIVSSIVIPPSSSDTSIPSSSAPPPSSTDEGTPSTSIVVSVPVSTPPPPSDTPSSSAPLSSSEPVISFPSSVVSASITTDSGVSSAESASITEVPFTTITSISVDPNLSFVLTESSLALASVAPTSTLTTLTDPDQVTSTVEPIPTASGAGATTALSAALPTGIPARILPSDQLSSNTDLSGDTLIAIKLDTTDLNWAFVVSNQISSSQIFAYIPVLISAALGISGDQIKTFALQVYVPTTYRSAADIQELGTMWLGYIPTDLVDQLAAEIKAKQSPFYIGVADPVARSLAQRVDSGFSITSVAPGTAGLNSGGSGGSGSGGTAAGAAGAAAAGDSKSRQDAIIGVVSALGAIALLVLVFLVYRSMRHRRQLAHHRLSDPPMMAVGAGAGASTSPGAGGNGGGGGGGGFEGVRPEGREFDEDSIGEARRRSFYFAEDSLRGYQQPGVERQEDAWSNVGAGAGGMSQRRNVVPATISAPILRENTMNW